MISAQKITELVEEHLTGSEFFLVEVKVKPGNRISVFLDGDCGVTIEACMEVNHFLNSRLNRDEEDYDLTVSSAGVGNPLILPRQYRKTVGKPLEIVTRSGEKLTGTTRKVDEEGVALEIMPAGKKGKEPLPGELYLKYSDIRTAKEVITFKP